jgi:dipeptidyl aminopeptidase/acylaminoacyl peptidase
VDDEQNTLWYIAAGATDPLDMHLYRSDLTTGVAQQITPGSGRHDVTISPDARWVIDTVQSIERAPRTVLRRADGTEVCTLAESEARWSSGA